MDDVGLIIDLRPLGLIDTGDDKNKRKYYYLNPLYDAIKRIESENLKPTGVVVTYDQMTVLTDVCNNYVGELAIDFTRQHNNKLLGLQIIEMTEPTPERR